MEDSWGRLFRPNHQQQQEGNNNNMTSCPPPPPPPPPPSFDPSFQYKPPPPPPPPPYFDPTTISNRIIPHSFDDRLNSIRPPLPGGMDVYSNSNYNQLFSSSIDPGYQQPSSRFVESDRTSSSSSVKRMRVSDDNIMSYINGTRFSSEDERRLSLIRQHGASLSQLEVGSKFGLGSDGGNKLNRYNWQPRPVSNSFYDPRGQVLHQESVIDIAYGGNEKKQIGRGDQGLGDADHHNGFRLDRDPMLFTSRNEPYPSQPHSAVLFQEEESQQQPNISHYAPYRIPQESSNMYHGNDSYRLNQNEYTHTRVGNSPLSPGSGIPSFYDNTQNFHIHGQQSDARLSHPPVDNFQASVGPYNSSVGEQFGAQGTYLPIFGGNSMASIRQVQGLTSRALEVYPPLPPMPPPGALGVYPPPLPPMPPPSLPMEPPGPPPEYRQDRASPPTIPLASSTVVHPSAREGQLFPLKNPSLDKPKTVDASSLFKWPNRNTRPDHIVVILRGLPGSGKSYLAKMLRDLEVESGANAPRIHSMDDYFMTEVEKVEESEASKSSGSVKGKKRVIKKVMEYCYEPEMEEAYRSSLLKAFKKTLEDGIFTFIIVDDRNLRIADFAQFWASAKRSGYEVYLLEAVYKDPVGCAARNIHSFTSDDIQKMAELWEEAPSLYLRLDIQSLLHGDDLKEHGIQEVDMDMDDVACDEGPSGLQNRNLLKTVELPQEYRVSDDSVKEEERWDAERNDPRIKELGRSKWSHDADEEEIERSEQAKRASNALSGLIQAYTKGNKSVHWGDQIGKCGFSIGGSKRANVLSLVIGPGAGYNMKSNPLPEEENEGATDISWQSKKRSVFEEQLRAERASERESFKSVIDRRRRRIGGHEMEDE